MPDTAYIILQRVTATADLDVTAILWRVEDPAVHAPSAEAAIRKHATTDGIYVAIPGRSFKPVAVETIQTTTLKISEEAPAVDADATPATE